MEDTITRTFTELLNSLIDGATPKDIHAGTGIDPSKLSRYRSGDVGFKPGDIDKLAEYFGLRFVRKSSLEAIVNKEEVDLIISSLLQEIKNLERLFSGASVYWAKERARNGK
ncbi:MAG: hypothetical protein ABFD81_18050 [Syntrophaceae bacterium]